MGTFASRLELHNDFVELLPPNLSQVKTIRYVLSETGGVSYQAVTTVSPNREQNRKFLRDIRKKLNRFFWEPEWSSAHRIQEEYERVGQLLRGILRYSKYPDPHEEDHLRMRIKHLAKVPMVDYALDRYDRKFFEDRQLLFLTPQELKKIYKRLKSQIGQATLSGMGLGLDDDDKKKKKTKKKIKLDFSDIQEKYKKQLQDSPSRIEVKQGNIYSNALMIRPRGASTDLIFTQHFVALLRKTVKDLKPKQYNAQMKVWLQGAYRNNLREFAGINRDVRNSIAITFVLLVLLLLVFFRRLRVLWLVPLPLVMGTICTFGITYLTIGYLTTVTGFIGALLFGLGIDYGVFFMDRYFQERRNGESIEQALEICYSWAGTAIATAGLTTAAGFFALGVCRFRGFTQFGFIGGTGIIFCLVSMMTVLPALIALTDRWRPMTPPSARLKSSKLLGRAYPGALAFTIIGVATVALSFYTLPRVPSEVDMRRLGLRNAKIEEDSRRWRRFEKLFHRNGMVPIIFLAHQEDSARYLTKEAARRGKEARRKHPEWKKKVVIQSISAFDFIPQEQERKLRIIRKIQRYLQRNEDEILDNKEARRVYKKYKPLFQVESFTVDDLPSHLQRDLVLHNRDDFTKVKGYIIAIVSDMNLSNGNAVQKLNNVLRNTAYKGRRYDPSGEPIIFAEVTRVIEQDSFVAVAASLLAIALLVLLDLRNFRLTLLALWPLLTGLLGLSIILYFFDIRVNMFNMVVFPALLGIGVDAGVHMLHRYRERPSLGTLGVQVDLMGPIAVASATTVISFATMITAQHMGMQSVGILAVAGLATCLFSTYVLLPALMELIFRKYPITSKESVEVLKNTNASSGTG